jgi:hypothetical protein
MNKMVGYTPEEAERLKRQIDGDMAKIEGAVAAMVRRVPDHSEYVDGALEQLREVSQRLRDLIERRTL